MANKIQTWWDRIPFGSKLTIVFVIVTALMNYTVLSGQVEVNSQQAADNKKAIDELKEIKVSKSEYENIMKELKDTNKKIDGVDGRINNIFENYNLVKK